MKALSVNEYQKFKRGIDSKGSLNIGKHRDFGIKRGEDIAQLIMQLYKTSTPYKIRVYELPLMHGKFVCELSRLNDITGKYDVQDSMEFDNLPDAMDEFYKSIEEAKEDGFKYIAVRKDLYKEAL
jgi:hypothetical protein